MKKIYFVALIFWCMAQQQLYAQTFNANLAVKLQHKLDSMVTVFSYNTPGLSAGVYIPGQGMWRGTSGISHTGTPLTSNMQMGIASNTKLFTAVTVLKMVEDSILSLNDSVKKWLPTYANVNPKITIRQLLNHTSGLSDPFFTTSLLDTIRKYPSKVYTPTEVLSLLGPKAYDPGIGYQYSNINYILCGMIAKVATGVDISKLTKDYILKPQQLDSTFCDIQDSVNGIIAHRHVKMVDLHDTSRISINTAGGPAGYIFSTSGDLLKWYNALFSGQVLKKSSFNELTTFALPGNYALGLQKSTFYGRTTWGHAGSSPGYKSRMVYDTAMKVIVCGLSNDDYSAIDGITVTLYKVVLDLLPLNAGAITGPLTVCQNSNSITYSVAPITNASTYLWTLPKGVIGTSSTNSITVNFTDSAISGSITVAGVNSYGMGYPFSLNVNVNPLPSANATIIGSNTVCPGQDSVLYSIQPLSNATSYAWILPTGATGNSVTNSIRVHFLQNASTGSISVKGNNTCGSGKSMSYAISVKSLPPNPDSISGPTQVCQNQGSLSYSINALANTNSYIWTYPKGCIGTSDSTNLKLILTDSSQSGNITVKGINACGMGNAFTLPLTIIALPSSATSIIGDTLVCQNQDSVKYKINAINNALTYQWVLPSGAIGTSDSNSIAIHFTRDATNGLIGVTGVNGCGTGPTSILSIKVNPLPVKPGLTFGPNSLCAGSDSINYFTSNILNAASYNWVLSSGISGYSTTNSIYLKFAANAQSGQITVNGINVCGSGDTLIKNIEVLPLPEMSGNINGFANVCAGKDSVLYSIPSSINTTSYQWRLPKNYNGSSNSNSIYISFGRNALSDTIQVHGANNCGTGLPTNLSIKINPLPADAGAISGPTEICSGTDSITYSVNSIQYQYNYVWSNNFGALLIGNADSVVKFKFTTASTGLISVHGVNACGVGKESSKPITVHATPPPPVITLNGNTLHSNAPNGNQWYFQNTAIVGATSQDFVAAANGNYYSIVTTNGCNSAPSNVKQVTLTSVKQMEKQHDLEIYPLPFLDELHIHRSSNKNIEVQLMNTIGQLVYQGKSVEKDFSIDTSQLPAGVYYIKIGENEWKRVICNKE